MTLTITDYFEQVDGLSIQDAQPEVRSRINEALADLTSDITGPQSEPSEGSSPGDPDAVVVNNTAEDGFDTIQAAVNDPDTESGNTILIRAGEYATEGKVTVTDPGELRLVGTGSGADPSSNTIVQSQIEVEVTESSGNGVTLQDLRIADVSNDGSEIDTTVSFGGSALRDIGIENVSFIDNAVNGLDIQEPAENLAVRDCLIKNNGDNGIEGEEITNAVVSNCEVLGNNRNGIEIKDTEMLTVRGSTIQDNSESGIEFDGDGVGITVAGSTIENNGEEGIVTNELIDPSSNITDAEFRRTTVKNNGSEGIGLFSNNISTLVFEDLDVSSNFSEGIELFGNDIDEIEIADVTADDNGGIGIALGDTFDISIPTVSMLSIRDTSASGNGFEGVLVDTQQIDDVTFTNVSASNNALEGIDLFGNGIDEVEIADVTADDNDGIGIALGGSFDDPVSTVPMVNIRDTSADGNGSEGVLVNTQQIDDLTFTNVSASGNAFEGIDVFGNDIDEVEITDVTADDNDGIGIAFGGSFDDPVSTVSMVNIHDTSADGNGSEGVLVDTPQIDDLTFTNVSASDNAFEGIDLFGNDIGTIDITDVTTDDNEGIGIALGGAINGDRDPMTAVSTVDISDTSADGNLGEGILVGTEEITDLGLTNLSASNNDREGIDLFGNTLSNVSISRVTARANGGVGTFVGNSTNDAGIQDLSIEKSVVAESGLDGVLVAGDTTNATITESNIVDNAFVGVFKRNGEGIITVEDSYISGNNDSTVGEITKTGSRSSSASGIGADDD